MTQSDIANVLCVPSEEPYNNYNTKLNCSNNISRKYINYTNYIPWPTPFEVAIEMQTMVKCEHLAAEMRGWSDFDWAEHCLKQARGIPEDEVCEQYTLGQWQFMSEKNKFLNVSDPFD